MKPVGLLQLLGARRSRCNTFQDYSSDQDSSPPSSSSGCSSTSRYAEKQRHKGEDLAFNRTPGLVLLLVLVLVATTIGSVRQCALYLNVNEKPGKHLKFIEPSTRGSVTGVRG